MQRRKFLSLAGGVVVIAGSTYLLSDKQNFIRDDIEKDSSTKIVFSTDEREILYLASMAPSGHNTQPWLVKYVEPYHWVIGNDKSKWLPAVDPLQRETLLSIGTFIQNLEYAANHYGYYCQWNLLATNNQDEDVIKVVLKKTEYKSAFEISQIKLRRTVRSGYAAAILKKEDLQYIAGGDTEYLHYFPNTAKEHRWLNEQTIEANRMQSYRDAAQNELADWIRFSSKDAEKYCDGLTAASMEINGLPGWVVRNFYGKASVMKTNFRETSIDTAKKQVAQSGGWLIITSKGNTVMELLEAGKQMQRLFLNVRNRGIGIHPMTQILEEPTTNEAVNKAIGIAEPIQFLLRTGYVNNYPEPVSLRRPVNQFIRYAEKS